MATERRKGDKVEGIPTDDWNEFCRTSKKLDQLLKNGPPPSPFSGASTLTVQVFNTTGDLIEARFPILKLSAPCFTVEDRETVINEGILFNGETPDADTSIGDIAIVQGPIADGVCGAAVFIGPTWCEVEVTDEDHTHAAPSDGENTKLASGGGGAKIIWKESGTGTKKAVVMLGGGGSGDTSLNFGVATTDIDAATGDVPADWGDGTFEAIDWVGVHAGDAAIKNRLYSVVSSGVHFWWMRSPDGVPVVVMPDCV